VVVNPLQIGPRPTTILRRAGTFPARTERVAASWVHRQHRFEPEVTHPVIDEIIDIAEPLPPMEAQRCKWHVARITIDVRTIQPWRAIRLAMDVKRVKRGVTPREDDLQRRMESGQGRIATDEEPTPDQGADPLDDYTELIDVG
jgi:hypothetical protein